MILTFVDQRAREPNDAWNMAAAGVLWLLIDTTDPIAAFSPAPTVVESAVKADICRADLPEIMSKAIALPASQARLLQCGRRPPI